ncbi:hypothetical protein [Aureimonas ureilytica]|uniref:hypothetical protein n=1 Tax=Aureimonas ureilytica TaxID=401562 RepID=UPI00036A6A45|nr:hypothetical protein [Aureimonas ureilytica]
MHRLHRLTLCGFSLLAMVTAASAEPIVPVNDDPPMAGFPEGAVLDILGVKLGMTPDEVRAAYSGPLDGTNTRIYEANSENGANFELEYLLKLETPLAVQLESRNRADGLDHIRVTFGSPYVGGRVIKIERTWDPEREKPISRRAYEELLVKKYGKPTAIMGANQEPVWMYDALKLITMDRIPEAYDLDTNVALYSAPSGRITNETEGPMPTCWQSEFGQFGEQQLPYKFTSKRKLFEDACAGGLRVDFIGSTNVSSATFVAFDQQRIQSDVKALDAAIEKALSNRPANLMEPSL